MLRNFVPRYNNCLSLFIFIVNYCNVNVDVNECKDGDGRGHVQ